MVELVDIMNMLTTAFPVVSAGTVSAVLVIIAYNFLSGQINWLKEQEILDANTAFLLNTRALCSYLLLVFMQLSGVG